MNKKLIISLVVALALASLTYATYSFFASEDTIGAMRPSGISVRIRQDLVSGASRTGSTLVIDPIVTKDGHRVVMSDIGSISFGKIDQGNSSEEIISWTGITDNTSTYTLTGVNWGYNFYNTSTSTANYKKHISGASFIITNDDHYLQATYVDRFTAQVISAVKTFTYLPRLVSYIVPTADEELAPKKYVDDIAISGAPDATETVKGLGQLATRAQALIGTILGSTGARLFLPNSIASSSSDMATTSVVTTLGTGYINPNFYQSNVNVWSATNTFSNLYIGETSTATLVGNATTTLHYHPTTMGNFSKNMTDGSGTGTTTINHLLGVKPRMIKINGVNVTNTSGINGAFSNGMWMNDSQQSLYYSIGSSQQVSGVNTTYVVYLFDVGSASAVQGGTITVSSTQIIISWTKFNSPTGTGYFTWEAYQ